MPTSSFPEWESHSSSPVHESQTRSQTTFWNTDTWFFPSLSGLPLLATDIYNTCQQHFGLEILVPPGIYKRTGVGSTGAGAYPMKCKESRAPPFPWLPSSLRHSGYKCHIHFLPQWSTVWTHVCRCSSVAIPTPTGDYFILAELPFATTCLCSIQPSWLLPQLTYPFSGLMVSCGFCGSCPNMVVDFGIRSN